jgi:hypothetical protein
LLKAIKPDIYVSIVDNLAEIAENLKNDLYGRYKSMSLLDVIDWREAEIAETARMARESWVAPHRLFLRGDDIANLYAYIFLPERKAIYFSFPITHASDEQRSQSLAVIDELRVHFTVVNPGVITDVEFAQKLQSLPEDSSLRVGDLASLDGKIGQATVNRDYQLIDQSQIVLANYAVAINQEATTASIAADPYVPLSAGVICEMVHGDRRGKVVLAVWHPAAKPSPFFVYHAARVVADGREAVQYLTDNEL